MNGDVLAKSLFSSTKITRKGLGLDEYPNTVPFGEIKTYTFSVIGTGNSYEWKAPNGWSINGGGNTYTGTNSVQITTSKCPTNEKVMVKMAGTSSAWTEFPTTVELPTIRVLSGQIAQYQESSFFMRIVYADIDFVEWFVNGNSVGVVNNSSSFSTYFIESGSVEISAKLTMKGCHSVLIPGIEVNVAKAPVPLILGPSSICDEGAYEIKNLPPTATVKWSVGNNLKIIRGQGTSSITVKRTSLDYSRNNSVTVEITVFGNKFSLDKSNIEISSFEPSILLGPFSSRPPVTHLEYGVVGKKYWIYASGTNLSQNDSDYKWKLYSDDPFKLPIQGVGRQIEYIQFSPGNFTVSLQYNGECGWTNELFKTIRIENSELYLSLFPNPSTDIVNIEFEGYDIDNKMFIGNTTNKTFSSDIVEIQLWSATSLIRTYKTDQEAYQFSVSDLTKGIYFVRVIKDGKIYTEKLIKN